MKKLIQKNLGERGSFRRNSLIMSSGAIINIIIAFVLTPIVTRIYDQKEFGVFYIFSSIVAISTLIINGMYPHALVVPKERKDFLALLKLCFMMTGIGIIIFSLFILVGGHWFLELIHGEQIGNYIYLMPVALLFSSLNVIFINWNVRRKEFKKNASSNVASSLVAKGTQIGYGTLLYDTFPGLIFSDIIAKIIGTIILFSKNMKAEFIYFKSISKKDVISSAKEYDKYPKFVLMGNFINRFTGDIPLYILSSFFGLGAVGAFGFANQMLSIPYNVIGNSIAPVYFQRANELYQKNKKALQDFTISSYNKMLLLGGLAFGFIFGFGDIVFKLVFSSEWQLAGQIARVLSIFYIFKLISSPFSRIFRVVRKEEYGMYINILIAMSRIVGIGVGILFKDILMTILFFSIGNIIGYFSTNLMVFKAINIHVKKILLSSLGKIVGIYSAFYIFRIVLVFFGVL